MQYFESGQDIMEYAIVQAIPSVYNTVFAMVTSGDVDQTIAGLLAFLGITLLILRGVWKMIAKVIWKQITGPTF